MDISNIRIVLVGPQGMLNVGSVARAMKNMGLGELALVAPAGSPLHPDARIMAVRADDILENASIFRDLIEAVADCTWVVGTTRRRGKGREEVIDPRQLASEMTAIESQNKVAIVFGSEASGLSNRDLDQCQRLVSIPADEEYGSLNLAQAVMLVCYELFMAAQYRKEVEETRRLATSEELEGMYQHMEEVLLRIGFLHEDNPKRMMAVMRRIFGRAQLDSREVRVLRGICRQMNWYTNQLDSPDTRSL